MVWAQRVPDHMVVVRRMAVAAGITAGQAARIDLMRVVSGLLLPAVAYLARRKTRWDYSKCHKRRRQARRARFAPY